MKILDYGYYNFREFIDPFILENTGYKTWTYNTSVVKAQGDNVDYLIYAIRTDLYNPNINFNDIIPGNSEACEDYEDRGINIDYGKNFVWNNWSKINIHGYNEILKGSYTCFILYNMNTNEFNLLEIKNPKPSMNRFTKTTKYLIKLGDVRICNIDNEIIVHSSALDFISKINIDIKNFTIVFDILTIGNKLYSYHVVHKKQYPYSHRMNGSNYTIINIIQNKKIRVLDWFYPTGLYISQININTKNVLQKYYPYNPGYEIDGIGSTLINDDLDSFDEEDDDEYSIKINYGLMPMLSFSTPLLKLDNNNNYLGIGHLKISNNKNYIDGSNISIFRDKVHTELRSLYGVNYKIHLGSNLAPYCIWYIYCMYFYIYNDITNEFKLSDAYLPIHLNSGNKYLFSLIFPMGLEKLNDTDILITSGEGDYYSSYIKLNLNDTISLCTHNLYELNFNNYNYNITYYSQ